MVDLRKEKEERMKKLVLLQLSAAAPASLSFRTLQKGIASDEVANEEGLKDILMRLMSEKKIIEFGDDESRKRYGVVGSDL